MDERFEPMLDGLLASDDRGTAWAWVQDTAREFGPMLQDQTLSTQFRVAG
jgi:hypothetical protein